jgi:hypothetical protein
MTASYSVTGHMSPPYSLHPLGDKKRNDKLFLWDRPTVSTIIFTLSFGDKKGYDSLL